MSAWSTRLADSLAWLVSEGYFFLLMQANLCFTIKFLSSEVKFKTTLLISKERFIGVTSLD
jgi:hypothetical protein